MGRRDKVSSRFHGIVPATPTPFTSSGEVDEACLRRLIDTYLEAGVHGISVAGSQGEFYALDDAERLRIIEIAVDVVGGRVPVYAGTGSVTTRRSIEITRAAADIGADIGMVVTPYFISPSDDELTDHFHRVADATPLPLLIYNNPPRTGVNVTPSTLRRCLEFDTVIGVKDSGGDLTQALEYRALDRDPLVFCGRDTLILALLLHGAAGGISPAACVFPRLVVCLYEAYQRGDLTEAGRLADVLAPLRRAWSLGSFPVVIKAAMARVGADPGPPRAPIRTLDPHTYDRLGDVVDAIAKVEADLGAGGRT